MMTTNDLDRIRKFAHDNSLAGFEDHPDVLFYRFQATRIMLELCNEVEELRLKLSNTMKYSEWAGNELSTIDNDLKKCMSALKQYADPNNWRCEIGAGFSDRPYNYIWTGNSLPSPHAPGHSIAVDTLEEIEAIR